MKIENKLFNEAKRITGVSPKWVEASDFPYWSVAFDNKLHAYTLVIEGYHAHKSIRVYYAKNVDSWVVTHDPHQERFEFIKH